VRNKERGITVISARFISLFLTALSAGVVLSHVMSRAGKLTLSGPLFTTVQNTFYRGWGKKVGAIELGAFLASLAVTFLARGRSPAFALCLACSLCLLGMLFVCAVFINPLNVRVRASSPTTVPADWTSLRDRWHRFHAVRAILAIAGLSALISVVLLDCAR
jgi:anthrone oxygenase-like protein